MRTRYPLRVIAAASLAACLAGAGAASATYFVTAKATMSAGPGTCTDIDDSGVLYNTVTSTGASALACPSGASQAIVDIATASMGVFAFANSSPGFVTIATAEAEFFDVVHFHVPPAMDGQSFSLGVAFAVDGTMTADATPNVNTLLQSRCVLTDLSSSQGFDGLLTDALPVSGLRTIPGTLLITPPSYSMNVSMHMNAPGVIEGSVDYLTTAQLQLAVPPGVTYDSDSGVFQAPEPGACAAGAAALAALSARARVLRARPRRASRAGA